MTNAAPPLCLTRQQVRCVQRALQIARHHAFASLAPSPTRNSTLRQLQAIEGKLIVVLDQGTPLLRFAVSREEMAVVKTAIEQVRLLLFLEPATPERDALMAEMRALSLILEPF